MSPLILAAILATAFAQQNGYYHQEYNYRTSSSSYKNNELQHRNDDEGYYSKAGDLQGRYRPRVNTHSQHSEYVNPKAQNSYRMGPEQTASFGQLHAQDRFRMGENGMGGFSYGPTQHHYGMASDLREVTASLQEEMQRELQRAVFDQHQRAAAYGSISQAQIEEDRRILEEELRRNLTMRIQEALKMHYGNQGIRGAFSYSIVNGRLQPTANYDNRELEDLTRQMEAELIRHLDQQVQTQYHTRVDTQVHTTRNTYRINGGDNYPSALEQRPVYQPYPPPIMRPTHPVAPIPDSITTVATRVQTELNEILNKILEDTQRRYFSENAFHANVNYDHILAQLQEELRANITFHFDDQIKRAYGYSNYASKYSMEDIENLRRQIEANLVTKLNRDFNRQREKYLQTHMYVVEPMQPQGQPMQPMQPRVQPMQPRIHPMPTSIHPMPTSLRPMPNIYYPVNNGQYNQDVAEMQRRLHEQLSRQLQTALMQQSYRQAHMYTGSGFNPQANYEATLNQLAAELNRNLTRQMELLNTEQFQSGLHTTQLANMRNQLQQDLTRQLQQGLQQSYSRYSSWSASSSSSSSGGSYRPVRGFVYGVHGGSVEPVGEDCMMGDDPTVHKRKIRDLTQQVQTNDDLTQQTLDDDALTQQVQTNDDLTQQTQDLTQQTLDDDNLTQQVETNDNLTQQVQTHNDLTQQVQTNDDLTQQSQTHDDLTQQTQQSNDFLGNERQSSGFGPMNYSPRPVYSTIDGHQVQVGTTRQLPKTHDALTQQVQTQDDYLTQQTQDLTQQTQDLTQQTQDLTQQPQTHDSLTQQDFAPAPVSYTLRPVYGQSQQVQTHDALTQQVQNDDLTQQSQDLTQQPQTHDSLTQQAQHFALAPVSYTPRPVYAQIDGHQVPVGTTRGLPQNQQALTHDALTQQTQNDDLTQQVQTHDALTQQTQNDDLTQQVQTHDALTQQTQNDDLTQQVQTYDDLTQQTQNDDLTQQSEDLRQQPQSTYPQRPVFLRPYQNQPIYSSPVFSQTQQKPLSYQTQTQQTEVVEPPYQRRQTYTSGSPNAYRNYQSYPQQSYTSTYEWRPQTSVGQRVQYYENLQRQRYQQVPRQSYSRYPVVQQQSQDLTQQTEDLTQQPYKPKVVYIPIAQPTRASHQPFSHSRDLTQQTQNQLWTPQSQHSQDLTQQTQDLTQQNQYLTPQSQDLTQQTQDLIQQNQYLTPQSQDLTQQTQDLTQQNLYLTPQSQDLTQQTQDLTQQTQDLSRQNQLWTPQSQQRRYLTPQSQDLTQQSQDSGFAPLQLDRDLPPSYEPGQVEILDETSQNPLVQQAQVFTNQQPQSDDLTQQSEDLTQQSQDLTQQTEDLTQQSQDLTQQTEDLTQQSQDIDQPIEPQISSNQIIQGSQQSRDLTPESQDLTQQTQDLTQETQEFTTLPEETPKQSTSDQRLTEAQRESQRLIDLLKNHQHQTQQRYDGTQEEQNPKGRSLVPSYHQVEIVEPETAETTRDIEPIEPQIANTVQQVDGTAAPDEVVGAEVTTKKPGWWSRFGTSIKNKLG